VILNKRTKIILSLVGLAVLITASVFVWAVRTGKLKFKAETVSLFTVSGRITPPPSPTVNWFPAFVAVWWLPSESRETTMNVVYGISDSQGNYTISVTGQSFPGAAKGYVYSNAGVYTPTVTSASVTPFRNIQKGQNLEINFTLSRYLHGYVVEAQDFSPIQGARVEAQGY